MTSNQETVLDNRSYCSDSQSHIQNLEGRLIDPNTCWWCSVAGSLKLTGDFIPVRPFNPNFA
jgi:hypothetical protein